MIHLTIWIKFAGLLILATNIIKLNLLLSTLTCFISISHYDSVLLSKKIVNLENFCKLKNNASIFCVKNGHFLTQHNLRVIILSCTRFSLTPLIARGSQPSISHFSHMKRMKIFSFGSLFQIIFQLLLLRCRYSRLRTPALRHYPDKNFVVRCNLFVLLLQQMALWISSRLTQLVSTVALTLATRSSCIFSFALNIQTLTHTFSTALSLLYIFLPLSFSLFLSLSVSLSLYFSSHFHSTFSVNSFCSVST